MNRKTTMLLLIAVLMTGWYIWYAERDPLTTDAESAKDRVAFPLDPEDMAYFRLQMGDRILECEKNEDQWMLKLPVRARADQGAIDRLIAQLNDVSKRAVITPDEMRRGEMHIADFGLIRPQAFVTIGDRRSRTRFLIGREAPVGDAVYVKQENGENIFSVSKKLLAQFEWQVETLLDRVLFHSYTAQMHRFEINRSDGVYQFTRGESGIWRIDRPVVGRANQGVIAGLVESLLHLRVEKFLVDGVTDLAVYGLDEPVMQIAIQNAETEKDQTLKVGKGLEEEPGLVYSMLEGEQKIMAVTTGLILRFSFPLDQVRDRRVVPFQPSAVTGVRIQKDEVVIELAKSEEGVWEIVVPKKWKADQQRVQAFILEWTAANIEAFQSQPVSEAQSNRYARSDCSIRFTKKSPEEDPETITVQVGEKNAANGRTELWVQPENAACEVADQLLDRLPLDPLSLKDKEVLSYSRDEIRMITLVREGKTMSLAKSELGTFQPVKDSGAVVQVKTVDELLVMLAGLPAADYVRPVAGEAVYGLDKPSALLTLWFTGDAGIGKTLQIGARHASGAWYASIRGQDVVFLLDAGTVEKLTRDLYVAPIE